MNDEDLKREEGSYFALGALLFATAVVSVVIWGWRERKLVKRYGMAIRRYIAWRVIFTAAAGAIVFAVMQLLWAWLGWGS